MRRAILMLLGLILLTTVIYWPVYRYPFIDFDDADYVAKNPFVQAGFSASGIHYAFTTYTMGNWNPLLWISFYFDQFLFHLQPGMMHVENVLLHLVGGLLLWRFLFEATGSLNRSFLVAALFLLHPMHVESVAWITERKDVLSTPLLISAMLMYVRFCRQPTRGRWLAYGAMLALFAMSLMVKGMGVTLPAVLLLMDVWPLRRWPRRSWAYLVLEKLPIFIVSLSAAILGSISQRYAGATPSFLELSPADRIGNAVVCYSIYLAKLLVPINLAVFYRHPGPRPLEQVLASAGLLIFISFFLIKLRNRTPYALIGWLWFVGTLVPVIGLVQMGGQAMADRYSYLPSIGFFILIIWGAADLLKRGWLQNTAAAFAMLCMTVLASIQVTTWRNSEALFTHVLTAQGDTPVAHVVLGGVAIQLKDPHRAVDEFNKALAFGPYAPAEGALGQAWLNDDPPRSVQYFKKAVELTPRDVKSRVGYSRALRRTGDFPEAIRQSQMALTIDPDDADARAELDRAQHRESQ